MEFFLAQYTVFRANCYKIVAIFLAKQYITATFVRQVGYIFPY